MAKMKGYNFKKADEGLGLGGNPDLGIRPEPITDSKDMMAPLAENEVVFTPPSDEKHLNHVELLQIMKEEAK